MVKKQNQSYAVRKKRRKKRKAAGKKTNFKKYRLIVSGIVLISFAITMYFPLSRKYKELTHPKDIGTVRVDRYRDLNEIHLKHAKTNGIKAFETEKAFNESITKLVEEGKLEKIEDNKYYILRPLSHSHPYLVPKAALLLEDIGKRFRQKLKENGKDPCYFQISSLLRTVENQKKLSRSNSNASPNSSHLYGTTFDIPYNKIVKKPLPWEKAEVADAPAIKILSETIGELRKEGRCVVVTERNETCFHITVK